MRVYQVHVADWYGYEVEANSELAALENAVEIANTETFTVLDAEVAATFEMEEGE